MFKNSTQTTLHNILKVIFFVEFALNGNFKNTIQ